MSVGSNLAEGCGRYATGDFRRFVEYATGSIAELEYQLLVARDLFYLSPHEFEVFEAEIEEIRKMLRGLHQYLLRKHT